MNVEVSLIPLSQLDAHIEGTNKATRDWTQRAARGECGWICSDCCLTFSQVMPDQCGVDDPRCTEIIARDKREAMKAGTEPS